MKRNRVWLGVCVCAGLFAGMIGLAAGQGFIGSYSHPVGDYSTETQTTCRATAVQLPLSIALGRANQALTPCTNDSGTLLNVTTGIGPEPTGVLRLLDSRLTLAGVVATTQRTAPQVRANTTVASLLVSIPTLGLTIKATGIRSSATASLSSCVSAPLTTGSSGIDTLEVNGLKVRVGDKPTTIPLAVGTLALNQATTAGGVITQRTLVLDLPGSALDLTIGETTAGMPCGSGPSAPTTLATTTTAVAPRR